MLQLATKEKAELASQDANKPIYGGYDAVSPENVNESQKQINFDDINKHIRNRAKDQLRISNGKNVRALIELGDIHFKNNKFTKASEAYVNALKLDDQNMIVYQKIVNSYIALSQLDKANKFYDLLIKKFNIEDILTPSYLSFKVMISTLDSSFLDSSERLMKQYSSSNNDNIQNVRGLFELLVKNNISSAITTFKKAISINSTTLDANNNIGIAYQRSGDHDLAEKAFLTAHRINLKYAAAYENLASLYFRQGNLEKSLEILQKSQENKAELSNDWKHNHAMFNFLLGNYRTAIDQYKTLKIAEPTNSLITNNIGVCYERMNDHELATLYFEEACMQVESNVKKRIKIDNRAALAFDNLAKEFLRSHMDHEVIQVTRRTKKLFPSHHVPYNQEAVIKMERGQYKAAKILLEKSIELEPRFIESYVNLSYILEDINEDYERAITLLESISVSKDLEVSKILDNNLAYAYIKTDRLDLAQPLFHEEDETYAALATQALYYLKKDDLDSAEKFYNKAFKASTGVINIKTKQYYHYEKMLYWLDKMDTDQAISEARLSLDYQINQSMAKTAKEIVSKYDSST